MPREQLWLMRRLAVVCAVILVGYVVIGLSASKIVQPVDHHDRVGAPRVRPRQLRVYRVPSQSMEPTLPIGTRVIVRQELPVVGAIVVVHPPEGSSRKECGPAPHVLGPGASACDTPIPEESKIDLIKRVVAGPGDEIFVRDGHVYRKANGSSKFVHERDRYVRSCGANSDCNFPEPIKIPSGHWFVVVDNRAKSDDSRSWGPVPTAWIVGVATALECPRFGTQGITWVRRASQE